MAAQTTYPVFDAFAKESPQAEHLSELKQYNQRCYALVRKVYERNLAAGKKGKELFRAYARLRAMPMDHTIFNLAMPLPKYEIFPEDHGAPVYAGAMGAAETLLNGEYRICSIEEEAECKKQDVDDHNAKIAQREKAAGSAAAAMMAGIANRFMGPPPAPAGARGK